MSKKALKLKKKQMINIARIKKGGKKLRIYYYHFKI